jgi:hypothetical protein
MMINKFKNKIYEYHEYLMVIVIILVSNLLWYNFKYPPVTGNSGFNIYPFRYLFISLKPYNFYSWPVSYIPPILGLPDNLIYSVFYFISFNSYGFAIFMSSVIWEISGAVSLFYLSKKFLSYNNLNKNFAYFSVIFLAFNEEIVNGAQFDTSASLLITAIAIIYLVIFKSYKYSLLAGVYSFFLFAGFPGGTLTYLEEIILILLLFFMIIIMLKKYKNKLFIKNAVFGILLSAIFIILANSYFALPFIGVKSLYFYALSSVHPSYAFSFSFDKIEILTNAIRLVNNWADYSGFAPLRMLPYLKNTYIYYMLFLIPFMSIISILFKHKKIDTLIYILMIITIFLSKANNPPFGNVFKYMILHFDILKPFYNGASFSPFLIIEYSLLFPLTLGYLYKYMDKIEKFNINKNIKKIIKNSKKIFPFIIIFIMLVSVYPQLSPQLVHGNPSTPLESRLPSYYYNASSLLMKHPDSAVMVFPEVNTFNSNTYNNVTWYNGVNIYPGIIHNPSVSNSYPLNYVGGKGNVYNILSYIYNPYYFYNHLSLYKNIANTENKSNPVNYTKILGSNITYYAYLSKAPFNDSAVYNKKNLTYTVNKSEYNNGGQWLIGNIKPDINISSYNYLILNYSLFNVNKSSMELGLFSGGVGNWYSFNSYVNIQNNSYNYLVIPIKEPSYNGGLNHYNNISAIVINYYGYDKNTANVQGNIIVNGFSLYKNNPVNYSSGAKYLYHDMKILGITYAYVDTSIDSGNGSYYNMLFSNDTSQFKLIFHEKSVYIYKLIENTSLFSYAKRVFYYDNNNELLSNLYDNLTNDHIAFVNSTLKLNETLYSNASIKLVSDENNVYKLNINHSNATIIGFKTDYNNNWVAYSGNIKLKHIEINGFENAWIVPRGIKNITVYYNIQNKYEIIEALTLAFPLIESILFLYTWRKRR